MGRKRNIRKKSMPKRHPAIPLTPRIHLRNVEIPTRKQENGENESERKQENDIEKQKRKLTRKLFCDELEDMDPFYSDDDHDKDPSYSPEDMESTHRPIEDPFDFDNDMVLPYGPLNEESFNIDYEDTNLLRKSHSPQLNKHVEKNIASQTEQCIAEPKFVPIASSNRLNRKTYFCFFCKTKISRFARHILGVHKYEEQVKEIAQLPPHSVERQRKIDILRKKGMFVYNTDAQYNKGDLIVPRRLRATKMRTADDFVPCSNCKGFYPANTLPAHYRRCTAQSSAKGALRTGRLLTKAPTSRYLEHVEHVLQLGRQDLVTAGIRRDETIMLFGARLCSKYMHVRHMDNHIRASLRLLIRFVWAMTSVEPKIKYLLDCLMPSRFEQLIVAVYNLCGYNKTERSFSTPSAAIHLGGILSQVCDTLITRSIQQDDDTLLKRIQTYKSLIRLEYSSYIARIGTATLVQRKMIAPKLIPLASDICKLNKYLRTTALETYDKLSEHFRYNDWRMLQAVTLALILIFNRRRTGETERLTIQNYSARCSIKKDSDIYKSLSKSEQATSHLFERVEMRGKWGRCVPLLLTNVHIKYIKKIIELRTEAGVDNMNPYVFGFGKESHLYAGKVLRDFSKRSGAQYPDTLRGTQLRKHIATVTQVIDMSDSDIKLLAQFMGHTALVHHENYRKTDSTLQIARLSMLLMAFNEGKLNEYKGRKLEDIDVDVTLDASPLKCSTSPVFIESHTSLEQDSIIPSTTMDESAAYISQKLRTPTKNTVTSTHRDECTMRTSLELITPIKNASIPEDVTATCIFQEFITPTKIMPRMSSNGKVSSRLSPRVSHRISADGKIRRRQAPKSTWKTPEKKIIRKVFGSYLVSQQLPSIQECKDVALKYPALRNRTPQIIKAYINNLQRKKRNVPSELNLVSKQRKN